MTTFAIYYLEANIVLIASTALIAAIAFGSERLSNIIRQRDAHRVAAIISLAALLYPLAAPFMPTQELISPSAQVWSAGSIKEFEASKTSEGQIATPSVVSSASGSSAFSLTHLGLIVSALILIGLLVGAIRVILGLNLIARLLKSSFRIRKIGTVEILASNEIAAPCSCWLFGRNIVLIPTTILCETEKFRLAVSHELQHHRQGDTRYVFVLQFLKHLFFFNPVSHMMEKNIERLQEFACDEALIDHQKVSPLQYGRCLIEVAESAMRTRRQPLGAVGMATSSSSSTLRRRINTMINQTNKKKRRSIGLLLGALTLSLMTATAYASRGSVQDRRVDMRTAQKLVDRDQSKTDFPIEINNRVLTQLNRYVGTPDGREFMRQALERMKAYGSMVRVKIQEYDHPEELLAVAIMESGFRNTLPNKNSMKAAGVWQFVPGTARRYDLAVNTRIDERLDIFLATDAAMRLLKDLNSRFGDWKLALMAYNAGGVKVQRGIDATGSRSAWDLIEAGYTGDRDYLAKVIAAAIVLKNPELVD